MAGTARPDPGGELEEVLRLIEVLEPMEAQVSETDRGLRIAQELRRRGRDEHLASMGGPTDPCCPMDSDPHVALVAGDGVGGVKAHPHLEPTVVRPRVSRELSLRLDGCPRRIVGTAERDEEGVPLRVDLAAARIGRRPADDPAMILERTAIALAAELPKQTRRALDVGEQERDRSARALGHLPRA